MFRALHITEKYANIISGDDMTDIVVIDEKSNLFDYAVDVLKKTYSVRSFDGRKLQYNGSGYQLNILKCDSIPLISADRCIVLLGEDSVYCDNASECELILVANSANNAQIESLKNCRYFTITCGNDMSDTVSYTSITDESITVSLNRTVKAMSGREIHPFEFPVENFSNQSIYEVLSVTAMRILLDDFNSELGRVY